MRATVDHLAVTAAELGQGEALVARALGTGLQAGGKHAAMGTHNRLLGLGLDLYLEVIAPDPEAGPPGRPRWFGLDRPPVPARLGAWVMAVNDLDAALALAPAGAGHPLALARGDLSWRMAVPPGGMLPFDGVFPALIQWEGAAHPARRLEDSGCRLHSLRLCHPRAEELSAALAPFLQDARVTVAHAAAPGLAARFDTPSGLRDLC